MSLENGAEHIVSLEFSQSQMFVVLAICNSLHLWHLQDHFFKTTQCSGLLALYVYKFFPIVWKSCLCQADVEMNQLLVRWGVDIPQTDRLLG